jgi:dsDNA-specific endonuclease/ATPase MutS2
MSSVAGGVLPGTVEEFQRLIREQNEKIRDLSAALLQKERELEHKDRELEQKYQELALLRHKLFGRMSEKLSGDVGAQIELAE